MQVSEIQLFQILREKVGDEQAKTLTEYVEAKIEKQFDLKKDTLASKQDIAELKIEIANVRNELKLEIGDLKIELKTDIANSRSDTIKWMFLFLFGQLAAIYAIVEIILKK